LDANVGRFIGQDPIGFSAGDSNLYRYVGNSPLNGSDPSGTKDTRWPSNGAVRNNSSNPVIILNSTNIGDFLETLRPGQATPDKIGRSKDVDGVWVCRNNRWVFYEVKVGELRLQTIPVQLPTTFGGSISVPVLVPRDATQGRVTVTNTQVKDGFGRVLSPGLPQNRGRVSSNNPPGGTFTCPNPNRVAQNYPDASVWHPVLRGDESDPQNTLERTLNGIESLPGLVKNQLRNTIQNIASPSSWRWLRF
jgi:hypothetical protein